MSTPEQEFPTRRYTGPISFFDDYAAEMLSTITRIDRASIAAVVDILPEAYQWGGYRVYVAGNGGAASIADHFACDHIKNVSTDTYWHSNVTSLAANTPLLTAIANDIGYDSIFSYQLDKLADQGDIFIAFSVSGNSANIVRALQHAHENGIRSIAIVACDGGKAASIADHVIHIPTSNYGIAEDIMQSITHALAQFLRHAHMSEEQIKSARF